jgi:multiple antibiotic resistance protein
VIGQISPRASSPQPAVPAQREPAVTPLAIPITVTPWGVTAILFFADLAFGNARMLAMVIGILLAVMLLNLLGMLLARYIIAHVGMASFQVLGWIFAVLQAGLAVDAVVTSLRNLALFA